MNKFLLRPEIYYGSNAIDYINQLKGKKACIVTDKFMVDLGFLDRVTKILDDKGITYKVFSEVEPDPSRETVLKGLNHIIEQKPDTLIAIGGGSPIDAAKAIMYFCIQTKEKLVEKELIKKPWFIAIPTTSGTGSEVTAYSVITDKKTNVKIPLVEDIMIPDVAILDYELTKTMPPSVTADTGMDILTHAIEAYVSPKASDFTNIYAEKAIEIVFDYLIKAYNDGEDIEARGKLHNASCMAGVAFSNSSLGINHSLAHSLGSAFKLPHGRSNAIFLPYVVSFNAGLRDSKIHNEEVAKKYHAIAKRIGLPASTLLEGVISIIEGMKLLNKTVNIPITIKEFGVEKEAFQKQLLDMAQSAYQDICTSGNAIAVTTEDLISILEEAYE
ncbi:1-propanol dehydrogenase PduQ [Alkaliphilus peptidifermentans]|uniref:Alcohol dehydrogenase, class IV n=1 Tax=Alkaliphilus peptidifermentans DSM 18978 TaxID=1120976 RepID=A0A1G5GZW3_9FIRM|nr:1-propanol dehydrogenase PduQ [Alkaliphilus peptidifermentans]SCY57133.1 Alcohol dehydrogenase, class IV [Alkaliphilus peptidifermentans DSM 18978]